VISVIIPTLCERTRGDLLRRAIRSVRCCGELVSAILVIVNGRQVHEPLYRELSADSTLRIERLPRGSLAAACLHGVNLVQSPFFAFLDDDDEYLPGGLIHRCKLIEGACDFVTTNGFRGTSSDVVFQPGGFDGSSPLASFARANWLTSCGGLYRTETVRGVFFERLPKYVEWTALSFRLLLAGMRFGYSEEPTFRIHDTPGSASKSRGALYAAVDLLGELIDCPVAPSVRSRLKSRRSAAYHDLSDYHLQTGSMAGAWMYHMMSLRYLHGRRYLSYTHRLLLQTLPFRRS
jgi:glycosyltransferase involved in cell wall biosynthesis